MRSLITLAAVLLISTTAFAEPDWDENPGIRGVDTGGRGGTIVRNAFGQTGYYERGPDAHVFWRRAMGPNAGYCDLEGPVGPASLSLIQKNDHIYVQGGNFRLFWWTTRGGEISDIRLFNGKLWYPLVHEKVVSTVGLLGPGGGQELIPVGFRAFRADTMPNFVVESPSDMGGNTPLFFLGEDRQAKWKVNRIDDEIRLDVTGQPATFMRQRSPMEIQQRYRVFPQGVVLCDFDVRLPEKAADSKVPLSKDDGNMTVREMGIGLTINDSLFSPLYEACRTHFMSRMGKRVGIEHKKFFTTRPHIVIDEMLPYFGVSTCWPGTGLKTYTNAMDISLESPKGLNGKTMITKPFYAKFDMYSLQFVYCLAWGLYSNSEGKPFIIEPGFAYSNRYVMALGSHRVSSGDGTAPSMRNNLLAQRIVIWKNSAQQGAAWYPATEDITQLAAKGLDVLILGKGWMSKPYDMGKAAGSYTPADETALKRVIDDCHARNIRVGLSMLGQEYHKLLEPKPFITQYLRKDFDGVFVEETSFLAPRGEIYPGAARIEGRDLPLGNEETGAYAQFLLTRQLRGLVGPKGFLLGTSDIGPSSSSLACFDAYMPNKSELAQMKEGLDPFVYYSFLNSCGSVLPAEEAALVPTGAGLGCSFAKNIEARADIARDVPAQDLWRKLEGFDRRQVSLYNGLTEESGHVKVANGTASLFVNAAGKCLLVAGNQQNKPLAVSATFDPKKLKVKTPSKSLDLAPRSVSAVAVD